MSGVNSDVVAFASVKDGKLFIHNRRLFDLKIASFKDGSEVEIEVTKRRATRSVPQNAYYWGVVLHLISEHTGDEPDDLHEYFKKRFIPKRLAIVNGNGVASDDGVIGGSTRKMNTIEFGEYVETIRRFAAEFLDVNIPDPDPNYSTAPRPAAAEEGYGYGV